MHTTLASCYREPWRTTLCDSRAFLRLFRRDSPLCPPPKLETLFFFDPAHKSAHLSAEPCGTLRPQLCSTHWCMSDADDCHGAQEFFCSRCLGGVRHSRVLALCRVCDWERHRQHGQHGCTAWSTIWSLLWWATFCPVDCGCAAGPERCACFTMQGSQKGPFMNF